MKKLFTLSFFCLLLGVTGVGAQDKKTWDFSKGVSDETIANLTEDSNWNVTMNDDGSFKQANEATKLSGPFVANKESIKELAGLELGTAGLSKNNNVIIFPSRFRINRDKMELIFPSLVNGQTITIVGRSANSSAEDRGIKAAYDYMERIEGPEDNLIRASLGEVKNVWKIVTSDNNPVEVKFTMIKGGVDFTLFMIDEGDVAKVTKAAYLYNGTADAALTALQARENTEVTPIDVTSATVTAEALRQYDVTIIGAGVPTDNAAVNVVKEALPFMPTLNLNANMYGAWGYGVAVAQEEPLGIVKNSKNALLSDVTIQEEDATKFFETGVKPIGVKLGDYFAGDDVPAVCVDMETPLIHSHNINHNGYVYVPYGDGASDALTLILSNAVSLLTDSKQDITAAAQPVVSQEFKDLKTIVTITAGRQQPKTRFYYTTDGSAPTENSTAYTEPFTLTEVCTVKAVAIAEGYSLSSAASLDIAIHSQPKTPVISAVEEDGKSIVTLTCESEDAVIWYNFEGITDTTKSSKYAEPFAITMPQNICAFSVAGEAVWSETATQRVLVKNPRVVIDVAGHFMAAKWDDVANGGGVFSNGKTAISMYDTTKDPIGKEVDPETGDEISIYPEVEWMMRDEPGEAPEWMVMSKGQSMLWQNLTAKTDQIGTNEGGYYPSVAEDIDALFPVSSYDIQFYSIFSGEHANAAIQSKNKYQAPLDIVVIANMQGGPILAQVSADGENWTTVGEEIAKTGFTRMWKKYTRAYEGTDEVFVRVTQQSGDASAKIFDIYVANQGEQSKALLQQLKEEYDNAGTGITDLTRSQQMVADGIYNLNGVRQSSLQSGINIVIVNGVAQKVIVK